MFYCDSCKDKKDWPESWAKSRGGCELCGKNSLCNDIPSKDLPKKPSIEDRIIEAVRNGKIKIKNGLYYINKEDLPQ